jgi:hypothetical protein
VGTLGKFSWKRGLAFVLAAALIISTVVFAILSAVSALAEEDRTPRYEIDMVFDERLLGVSVSERLFYVNETGQDLSALYFALPINAFRRQGTFPTEEGATIGGASIASVAVDGKEAQWGVQGDAETTLRISCYLEKGEWCEIAIALEALLPMANGLIGASEDSIRLYGIFPILAGYDASIDDFVVNEYCALDTKVFAEASEWDITFHTPSAYSLCAGGTVGMTKASNGGCIWKIAQSKTRCPLLVFGKNYRLYEGKSARVYAFSKTVARNALSACENVLPAYEMWFGAYPYGKIAVAQTTGFRDAGAAGAILITGEDTEYAVAFEAAKMWFGESVGNDNAKEAWLSDAVSAYVALLYFEERYGYDRFLKELNDRVLPALQITIPGLLYPDTETTRMGDIATYDEVVKLRGAACMHELRNLIGREKFLHGLKLLVERRKGEIATIADFAACMNEASGRETDRFVMETFRDIGNYVQQNLEWYE